MDASVESICNLLVRSRLLTPSGVRQLHLRWKAEAGAGIADVSRFSKWLVGCGFLTDYQCGLILRGKVDNFYLNDYKLLDRLGQGRMAGIYKASHQLGQTVAIKVLPPSKIKDQEQFGRFKREARLAVKLKHPHVVRTYQMGVSNGLHFIVMEYLDGDTLEEVLQKRKQLPPAEAARIVYQALQGLQHIHEMGMIHRDLKPLNLMLVPTPGNASNVTVKILDIGLGRALFDEEAGSPQSPDLTGTGALLGTPEYLAPEQARNAHTADVRADIYSLGCVLYHCLSGKPPFQDVNPVLQMVRHATEKARPLKEFNPAIPDGLQQIVDWMMAKDPAQRYPTPERAAQALQMFLTSGPDARPAEVEPQMQAYLKWLEVNGDGGGSETPMPVLAEAPSPRPAAAMPPPSPARAPMTPLPPAPARAAGPSATGIPAYAAAAVAIAEPLPSFVEVEPYAAPSAPMPTLMAAPAARARMGVRELLLLGFGLGMGLGTIVLIGFVGWLLIRRML